MKVYNSRSDDVGNADESLTVVFVPKEFILEDGTVTSFQQSDGSITTDKSGYVYVVKKEDVDKFKNLKIVEEEHK